MRFFFVWLALLFKSRTESFYLEDIQSFRKIQNVSDVLSLNSTQILFMKKLGRSHLQVPHFTNIDVIRNVALLLQIRDGIAFQHGVLQCPGVAIEADHSMFTFHQWELIVTNDIETGYSEIETIHNYEEVMTFAVPWGSVFSHLVGTMLPKIYFTCDLLIAKTNILILINSDLAYELFCEACSEVCSASAGPKRFLFQHKDSRSAIRANRLYFPLYIATDEALKTCNYCSGEGGNDVGSMPPNTIQLEHVQPAVVVDNPHVNRNSVPSPTLSNSNAELPSSMKEEQEHFRTLVYMPRSRQLHHKYRLMDHTNEAQLLQGLCATLSHRSNIQLSVFKSKGHYKKDILQNKHSSSSSSSSSLYSSMLRSARVILSPHSGAMANMVFAPPDTVVVELTNYDLPSSDRSNFFVASLARATGLLHVAVAPVSFSMWNPHTFVTVNVSQVIEVLQTKIPEILLHPFNGSSIADVRHREQCSDIIAAD